VERYILTGTPGAGKTAVLHRLRALGCPVVAEAATSVIAREQARGRPRPWNGERFIDQVIELQHRRQTRPAPPGPGFRVFDRSPVCTAALSASRSPLPSN
jgi:predicted ATPase